MAQLLQGHGAVPTSLAIPPPFPARGSGRRTPLRPLLSLLLLAGCGQAESFEEVASVTQAIVNGTPDPGHPSVGALRTPGGRLCTGTLVGRRTVLTAAHCVQMFGGETPSFQLGQRSYAVVGTTVHPDFDPATLDNDLAVLVLADAPPVASMAVSSQPPGLTDQVVLVGFGRTDAQDDASSGTKRVATNRVLWKTPTTFGYFTTWAGAGTFCFGDSGGPSTLRVGPREVLVGVHSRVDVRSILLGVSTRLNDALSGGLPNCTTAGFDVRADAYVAWLRQAAGGDVGIDEAVPAPPAQEVSVAPVGTAARPATAARAPVAIVAPAAGSVVAGGQVQVQAWIDDAFAATRVELLVNGRPLQTLTAAPFAFLVTLGPGRATLEVRAAGQGGGVSSALVQVEVMAATGPGAATAAGGSPPASAAPAAPAAAASGQGSCALVGRADAAPSEVALALLLLALLRRRERRGGPRTRTR